jgi:hypothetical protein
MPHNNEADNTLDGLGYSQKYKLLGKYTSFSGMNA